jgi:GNAT superfamily N-acetyltransferase
MFQLVERRLNKSEANLLVNQIKLTPNITGYSLKEWLTFDSVIVAEDEEEMVGVCLYYNFSKNWTFISVLFVLDNFRGKGIGKQLFFRACENIIKLKRNIYTSSREPIVINMMRQLDFEIFDTLFLLPEKYEKYEFVFFLRALKWLFSLYRLKEVYRKAIRFGKQESFVYGIKSC